MFYTPRLTRELEKISQNPPTGITCYPKDDKTDVLEAHILGASGSPFEQGVFKLELQIPSRYPFEPPRIHFVTPLYHPNVDAAGRICLDLLKMPPAGSWRPTVTIEGVLTAVHCLMAQPNPDDPLMPDIAEQYKFNKAEYLREAKEWTKKYACQNRCSRRDGSAKGDEPQTDDRTQEISPAVKSEHNT